MPSSGLGGSLERAWERKSRGTAHQCFKQSSWIIFSKIWPAAQLQTDILEKTFKKNSSRLMRDAVVYLCAVTAGC